MLCCLLLCVVWVGRRERGLAVYDSTETLVLVLEMDPVLLRNSETFLRPGKLVFSAHDLTSADFQLFLEVLVKLALENFIILQ